MQCQEKKQMLLETMANAGGWNIISSWGAVWRYRWRDEQPATAVSLSVFCLTFVTSAQLTLKQETNVKNVNLCSAVTSGHRQHNEYAAWY